MIVVVLATEECDAVLVVVDQRGEGVHVGHQTGVLGSCQGVRALQHGRAGIVGGNRQLVVRGRVGLKEGWIKLMLQSGT